MQTNKNYNLDTIEVSTNGDPLTIIETILRNELAESSYFVYEKQGEWALAIGNVCELKVLASGEVTLSGVAVEEKSIKNRSVVSSIDELMASLPFNHWRAYGTCDFEFSFLTHDIDGHEDQTNAVVLHLVIPSAEIKFSNDKASISVLPHYSNYGLDDLTKILDKPRALESVSIDSNDVPLESLKLSTDHDYQKLVTNAVDRIVNGDFLKVILSRQIPLPSNIDVIGSFVKGYKGNSPARSFIFKRQQEMAAGFSPETVVEVSANGHVSTQPLAGTRALLPCEKESLRLQENLLADSKEIAEHAMSVQLSFKELLNCCRSKSVAVTEYMSVLKRGTVQHLASRVEGQLSESKSPWHAFAELFPAVTASGIPKKEAIEFIKHHEPKPRGLYSGAMLQVDSNGEIDAALILRTLFKNNQHCWLQAGAGIVKDSKPNRELEETYEKLQSVASHLKFETAAAAN